jgi:hypothetical protein
MNNGQFTMTRVKGRFLKQKVKSFTIGTVLPIRKTVPFATIRRSASVKPKKAGIRDFDRRLEPGFSF